MVDVAKVNMFGFPVGTFRWDDRYDVVRFEYDQDFANRGLEPSPLMMPVHMGRVYSFPNLDRGTFQGLPGMLADSLPDTYGRALFEKWLALTGHTSSNPQGGWTSTHQMSINGKYDDITRADLLALAKLNNIKDAKSIIDEVCEAASQWQRIAIDCGVPKAIVEAISRNMLIERF